MTQNHQTDILIAGGGAPGLTLALLLAPLGLHVTVIDPAPFTGLKDARPDNRTAALMQGSIRIIEAAGGWAACRPYGAELRTLRIVDENSLRRKKIQADFNATEIGLDAFAVNMPNGILRAALCDAAKDCAAIRLTPGRRVTQLVPDDTGTTVTLDDGTALRARLVAGADGRQSQIRALSHISARTHEFGQSAITCLVEHSRPHDYISTEFHRPTGPFTLVPLPGKMSSVVWVDDTAAADAMMAVSKRAFETALQDRTRGVLGTVRLSGAPGCWPLIGLKTHRLCAPRAVLIAEAAHVIHPLGAQGLNLSLRDAAVLAETIADAARLGLDYGSRTVLESFEKRRMADIGGRVYGTEGFNHVVSNRKTAIHGLRRAGLQIVSNISLLRTLAMQQGLAPRDADSRLMNGGAL